MSIDLERLGKLLALSASPNDSEALAALRHVQRMLESAGHTMADLASPLLASLSNGKSNSSDTPVCWNVIDGGLPALEVRAAAPARRFLLPETANAEALQIAERFQDVLSQIKPPGTIQIHLEGHDPAVRVIANPPSGPHSEIWVGNRADAALIASALRRAAAHALDR